MIEIINSDFRKVKIERNVDLFIVDPPYGKIINDNYDQLNCEELVSLLFEILSWCEHSSQPGVTVYMFGCIGTYKNRPFFEFLHTLEKRTKWRIHNMIVWKKRRGYGATRNYMFTREEIAMLVFDSKYPNFYKPTYLNEEISLGWKKRLDKSKYKTRTKYKRRSNVFVDIGEVMRNQFSEIKFLAQKPVRLYDVLLESSCPDNGFVVDPMCGSGTTGIACSNKKLDCTLIEIDRITFDIAEKRNFGG